MLRRVPRRGCASPLVSSVHGNGAKRARSRDRKEINGGGRRRKRIHSRPGKKENEEGVDGFTWSGELANCLTIEERISRRISAVGRIANSAIASLSRSPRTSTPFPSISPMSLRGRTYPHTHPHTCPRTYKYTLLPYEPHGTLYALHAYLPRVTRSTLPRDPSS